MKLLLLTLMLTTACTTLKLQANVGDPSVVTDVDFTRYQGLWYEIARSPNFFQKSCLRSTAEYKLTSSDSVSVYNVCYKADNATSDISGTAKVVDPAVPAKLHVRFNMFAQGEYWITELDSNYQWAVVSSSNKSTLFILARQAPMNTELLNQILQTLTAKGFDLSKIVYDQY